MAVAVAVALAVAVAVAVLAALALADDVSRLHYRYGSIIDGYIRSYMVKFISNMRRLSPLNKYPNH